MPTTPATQVTYAFVADGSTEYTIPQWIKQQSDISIYFEQALQSSGYTVTGITSSQYTLTFSSAPSNGTNICILRHVGITNPTDYSPGSALTSEDLNSQNDTVFLQAVDSDFYRQNTTLGYGDVGLAPSGTIPAGDLVLPILSTPTSGHVGWVKDSTGAIIEAPLDATGGPTASQLQTDLAQSTVTTSGSSLVGHWNTVSGSASTVQTMVNSNQSSISSVTTTVNGITLNPATSSNAGTNEIYHWMATSIPNYVTAQSMSLSVIINLLLNVLRNADASDGGAKYVKFWDQYVPHETDVHTILDKVNGNCPSWIVGSYVPGLVSPSNGSWITIKAGETIGSASSGATHANDDYEALYKYILINYNNETQSQVDADWAAHSHFTPSNLPSGINITGINTFRYA